MLDQILTSFFVHRIDFLSTKFLWSRNCFWEFYYTYACTHIYVKLKERSDILRMSRCEIPFYTRFPKARMRSFLFFISDIKGFRGSLELTCVINEDENGSLSSDCLYIMFEWCSFIFRFQQQGVLIITLSVPKSSYIEPFAYDGDIVDVLLNVGCQIFSITSFSSYHEIFMVMDSICNKPKTIHKL